MIAEKRSGKSMPEIFMDIFYAETGKGVQRLLHVDIHDHSAQIEDYIFYINHFYA